MIARDKAHIQWNVRVRNSRPEPHDILVSDSPVAGYMCSHGASYTDWLINPASTPECVYAQLAVTVQRGREALNLQRQFAKIEGMGFVALAAKEAKAA